MRYEVFRSKYQLMINLNQNRWSRWARICISWTP